jgi:hypothetical protein
MSRHHYLELGHWMDALKQSNVILVSFNQALVRPLRCTIIGTKIRGKKLPMLFHVVPTCANVLVCYRDAVRASLISTLVCGDCDFFDFPDVETLSIYKKEIIHLELTSDAVPKNFPTRKVPLALEDEVREELQRMEGEGAIVKENSPTDWCSPLLVRQKPRKQRVCMDPRYLNAFLKRATYPLPDVESVFPKFRGAKYFSKLDDGGKVTNEVVSQFVDVRDVAAVESSPEEGDVQQQGDPRQVPRRGKGSQVPRHLR